MRDKEIIKKINEIIALINEVVTPSQTIEPIKE